jgi:hypothetical protein
MNGTGVGFSVEPQYVAQLPTVAERMVQTASTVVVEDSREGWARALREIIALLYTGHVRRRGWGGGWGWGGTGAGGWVGGGALCRRMLLMRRPT